MQGVELSLGGFNTPLFKARHINVKIKHTGRSYIETVKHQTKICDFRLVICLVF